MAESLMDATHISCKADILIVDDAPDNLLLLSTLLKNTYRIKAANNGEVALNVIKNGYIPDLILLDILMPGLSGYDVLDALQANPKTKNIPVIFLTSMDDEGNERYGLELGAVDYISKPISAPVVLAHVKAHLKNKAHADFRLSLNVDAPANS